MGEMIDGVWRRNGIESSLADGVLQRAKSVFRNWVTADGAAVEGRPTLRAEPGRFHLYVSLACPWAHRTLIMRAL